MQFICYHSKTCPPCQALMPTYNQNLQTLKDSFPANEVVFKTVDTTESAAPKWVQYTPMTVAISSNGRRTEYKGDKSSPSDIISFLKKLSPSPKKRKTLQRRRRQRSSSSSKTSRH